MAINKFVYNGEVKFDLTADTIEKSKVLAGYTFHANDGESYTGECTYDANTQDANALVSQVLAGQTYYAQGVKKTGSMTNNGPQAITISSRDAVLQIKQGYHDGSGFACISGAQTNKIIPQNIKSGISILGITGVYDGESKEVRQTKTVTPTAEGFTVQPDEGYTCLAEVVINAIPYREVANAYGTTIEIG